MPTSINGNRKKLAILTCLFVFTCIAGCRFYFQKTKDHYTAEKSRRSLQNGKDLASNICKGCHYDETAKRYAGIALNDLPRIGGRLYSANLTHSKTNGIIDKYTDAELLYLLRTGIGRSGKFMPYMMRPTMSDEDVNDLIIFFRSNDPQLAPADTTVGKTHINLIGRTGIRMAVRPAPYVKNVPSPNKKDPVAYGRYLVSIIGCYHCHSSKPFGLNYVNPEKSKGYLRGGMKLKDYSGGKVFSSNLTPDLETGIGKYTEKQFSRAVRQGVAPAGDTLSAPMPTFSDMKDREVNAIFAYLKSLPPVHHLIK